jgi:hypothetical protein
MTTHDDIRLGKLVNPTKITLAEGLIEFPVELFQFEETLEMLDLSGNLLTELPADMHRFKRLKIAFFSQNKFTIFPKQLADCPSLTMIGFKSNQLSEIPENAFPEKLQWLILTDNKLTILPESIGKCSYLQKVGLAGNQLTSLPKTMENCVSLELLRVSANKLVEIPTFLLKLPRLSWFAFSGNPCSEPINQTEAVAEIFWERLSIKEQLGEGASGFIYKATLDDTQEVAVKAFKGAVTTDGYPEDELATCLATGFHPSIVPLIASITNHPENKKGVVMEFIPSNYKNLGQPPTFETCTRDVFPIDRTFSFVQGVHILTSVLSAIKHLHQRGIMHGDLYAHNTLFREDGHAYLGDFGAATFYDKNSAAAYFLERLDVRAYGCLVEDVNSLIQDNEVGKISLTKLSEKCKLEAVVDRPSFSEIENFIESILFKKIIF